MNCDSCGELLTNWDYRYHGKHYCRKCYDIDFTLQTCTVCGRQRKISIDLKTPVCKTCQVKEKPCIRCGKTEYTNGKITADGPVCNSCSKYFREPKQCISCGTLSISVSNRNLSDGITKLVCRSCYNKTLPICYSCGKQRKAYTHDKNAHPICKICATEGERECIQCGKSFPAGKGRICRDCTYENTLQRKVRFGSRALSSYMSELYVRFAEWLKQRRGVLFAAVHLNRYLSYFSKLDDLAERLERIPTYSEVVVELTVAMTRANLLVTLFLDEEGIVPIDHKVQEEYANIDMITRYCERFEEGSWAQKAIDRYLQKLQSKSAKTSIRSIRLTIGSAANLLSHAECLSEPKINTNLLYGYLWKYPGQRSSITGFVNYLNRQYHLKLEMPTWKHPELSSPRQGRMQLKQLLIDLLRSPLQGEDYNNRLIRIAIAYLHGVDITENVCLKLENIKQTKNGDYMIRMAGREFYLPYELLRRFIVSPFFRELDQELSR